MIQPLPNRKDANDWPLKESCMPLWGLPSSILKCNSSYRWQATVGENTPVNVGEVRVVVVVQSLSHVRLFSTPWTAARQISLSSTLSRSLFMSIELVILTVSSSATLSSFCIQSFPASGSFPMSHFFKSGGQSIRVSVSASVLPMNVQDWLPSGLTSLISLQFKGLSSVFSNTTIQSINSSVLSFIFHLSHPYMITGKTIALTGRTFVAK